MSTKVEYRHLSVDDAGVPRITGTRYKVVHLAAEHYQHGYSAEELLRQHPDLRPEQVYNALAYFYDHYQEMVDEMKASLAAAQAARPAAPFSREELLRRKAAAGL